MADKPMVEFSVSRIFFLNAGQREETITCHVQNCSKSSIKLRTALRKSSNPVFTLMSGKDEKILAPGLKLSVSVKLTPVDSSESYNGYLDLIANDKIINTIPIICNPPSSNLSVYPANIDFGSIVCSHQYVTLTLTITNRGEASGAYSLSGDSLPSLFTDVSPNEGTLGPGDTQDIQISLLCREVVSINENLRVTLDGQEYSIPIVGHVVEPQLELLHEHTLTPIEGLSVGSAYYGTTTSKAITVYNNSPASTNFTVTLRSDTNKVTDMKKTLATACTSGGLYQNDWKEQGDSPGIERVFRVDPNEGIIGPYQTLRVMLHFSPSFEPSKSGWIQYKDIPGRRDYGIFLQFNPVGLNTKVTELGVTGAALPIKLSWEPKELVFGDSLRGVANCKTISITNQSSSLPLTYHIKLPAHYKTDNCNGSIQPLASRDTTVVFHPKQYGKLDGSLAIEVLGEHETKGPIAVYRVPMKGTCIIDNVIDQSNEVQLASVNDLSSSIRPHNKDIDVRTPYTKVKRHTYVDPDYAYTDRESSLVKAHKQMYRSYIDKERKTRLKKEINKKLGNPVYQTGTDIGIEPGAGISPLRIGLDGNGMEESDFVVSKRLRDLARITDPVIEPYGTNIVDQCHRRLSPKELSLVTLDPTSLKYGDIVRNSTVEGLLTFTNRHSQYILIQIKVKNPLLNVKSNDNMTNHWQCVLPPLSYTDISITLHASNIQGSFHESIQYAINYRHTYHIPVMATVVEMSLEISSSDVVLSQPHLSVMNYILEGHVTVINNHHVPAHFYWDLKEHDDYLIVTHMEGVVPAHSRLICTVYCQGATVPMDRQPLVITLGVKDGPNQQVSCYLKYEKSDCSLRESRILFTPASQFLTVNRTIHIDNKGESHGYYEVIGCSPLVDGLTVRPMNGCVPAGGTAPLTLQLQADQEMSFDSWLKISLRDGEKMVMRVAGVVVAPQVYVDIDQFNFGSVCCGAKACVPFTVFNMGQAHVELSFDLSTYPDFSLILPDNDDPYKDADIDLTALSDPSVGYYHLILPGSTGVECTLLFHPKDVASYDFIIPVLVNGSDPVPPPLSHWPPPNFNPQVALGNKLPSLKNTPKRRVLATGLVSPLLVENDEIKFHIAPEMKSTNQISHQEVILKNVSSGPLTWSLNTRAQPHIMDETFTFLTCPNGAPFDPPSLTCSPSHGDIGHLDALETFKFKIMFSPDHHGEYSASIPLYVNGNDSYPYKILSFNGLMSHGRISSVPTHISIQPVPLGVTVEAQFVIILERFYGGVSLIGEVPLSLPDGVMMSVNLCQPVQSGPISDIDNKISIPCLLSFSSTIPVSISHCLTFIETNTGIKRSVPFCVTADNSLFSTYEFLSENLNTACFQSSPRSLVPFLHLSSSHGTSTSLLSSTSIGKDHLFPSSLTGSAVEYGSLFLHQCKVAMCRYFSLFGWSNGIKLINKPQDLIECVGLQDSADMKRYSKAFTSSRGLLLDMIRYVCGTLPPGVPLNPPPCHNRNEKVNRHYQDLNTTLAFLRTQGALLWLVVPEALMDWKDFCYWKEINPSAKSIFSCITETEFHETSEKVWTHLMAQILKVLVIPKLLQSSSPGDGVVANDVVSNIYNTNELILLDWLNAHYDKEANKLFGEDYVTRLIQTFDVDLMDCTVLSCVLTSYVPSLCNSYFKDIYCDPMTPEQVSHNSQLLAQAIRSIGINYDVQASDFSVPNPLLLMLLCSHLYNVLPHYMPSSTVSLQGPLHSIVSKEITVSNNSKKSLMYRAVFMGDDAGYFNIEGQDNYITVAGKGTKCLSVAFDARCLGSHQCNLLLIPKGGGGRQGYPIAFRLIGDIDIVHPKSVIVKSVPLYDVTTISIPVANVLHEDVQYDVRLVEKEKLLEERQKRKKKKINQVASYETFVRSSWLEKRSVDSMKLFHTLKDGLVCGVEGGQTIELEYIPLKMKPRQCCVIIHNDKYGDTVYLISTSTHLPLPLLPIPPSSLPTTYIDAVSKTIHMKMVLGDTLKEVINISSNNEAFESAITRLGEWEIPPDERKQRQLTGSLGYTSLLLAIEALNLTSTRNTYKEPLTSSESSLHFDISCDSELLKLPDMLLVQTIDSTGARLPVEFTCDHEGHYPITIVMSSPHDVRVYQLGVTVIDKGRQAELEMKTHAMNQITQRIPLVNPTSMDWPLKVTLTGLWFSGPPSLTIPASSTGYYPLTFNPRREENVQGQLLLVNTHNLTEHHFKLTGISERPLAQENIAIHTQAKKRTTYILHVPNLIDRTTVYDVDTNLDFISGPPTLTVAANDLADCPIMIEPLVRGTYDGAIVFTVKSRSGCIRPQSDGGSEEHLWYQINVTVDPAEPVEVYNLTAPVFSSNTLDISISNYFTEPATLQAVVEGTYLTGPDELIVDKESQSLYRVEYSPLMLTRERARVVFMGRHDGEMTIEIELESFSPKPVELDPPQCELGKSVYTTLSLNNPLDSEVILTYTQTDPHFTVVGLDNGTLVLPPQSNSNVSVMFKPSQLGYNHETTLTFTSNEFGQQDFTANGEGLPPSPLPLTVISSTLNENSITMLSFTNPLSQPTNFDISLAADSDNFCIFLKQSHNICLHPNVSLDIPVMYGPDAVRMSRAEISVTARGTSDESLTWVYPILGQPEIIASSGFDFAVRAKERKEEKLVVQLEQDNGGSYTSGSMMLSDGSSDDITDNNIKDKYTYQLVSSGENEGILQLSTGLKLIKEKVFDQMVELEFGLVFLPPKPFSCVCELHVQPHGYGLWRFPVTLTGTDPSPDDVIVLQAQHLTKEIKKGFRLTSLTNQATPFRASLVTSTPELSFTPVAGVLPPEHQKGQLFTVTYQPRSFNKNCNGRLIIETPSSCWSYEVIGKPLTPVNASVQAKVDHIRHVVVPSSSKRNFIRQNVQQLTQTY